MTDHPRQGAVERSYLRLATQPEPHPMLRATAIIRKPAVKAERVIDTVVLDHDARQKRRVTLTGAGGIEFLMDLDKPQALNDGDALKLDDGRLVAVQAAPENLLQITAENPLRLMTVAWHIGNRHTPAEITADAIFIEQDHVLAEMVRGLGCTATPVVRPFRPAAGAYAGGHSHAHGHDHHDHGHDHAHDHGHSHAHDHKHEHHGHDHKAQAHSHDHDHAHDHAHKADGSCCGGKHGH
jgi:urease accessory protein